MASPGNESKAAGQAASPAPPPPESSEGYGGVGGVILSCKVLSGCCFYYFPTLEKDLNFGSFYYIE